MREFLLIFSLILLVQANHDIKYVKQLTSQEFKEEVIKSPIFVLFFAPWCGHCKQAMPSWEQLGQKYNENDKSQVATIAMVDCTKEQEICGEQNVQGYPTIKLFQSIDKHDEYHGGRSFSEFHKFLAKKLLGDENADNDLPETEEFEGENLVIELSPSNIDLLTKEGHHFLMYYAPWCPHCEDLFPIWKKLASEFKNDATVSLSRADCTKYPAICPRGDMTGYPTMFWYTNGKSVEKYVGPREYPDFSDYVNAMSGERSDAKHASAELGQINVRQLDQYNFEDAIDGMMVFVQFMAPWCGHCKRMAPAWEKLGEKYSVYQSLMIAKVDCTKNRPICDKHEVKGFPTLYWFENGRRIEEFPDEVLDRSFSNFVAFVEKYIGAPPPVRDEL